MDEPTPIVVVVDDRYEGHDAATDELGDAFALHTVESLAQAVATVAELDTPLVLVPYNLQPVSGVRLLEALADGGYAFVGLLLVDAPDVLTLRGLGELRGVHAFVQRPLQSGAVLLHARAGAAHRARRLAANAAAEAAGTDLDTLRHALRHELRGQLQGALGLAGLLKSMESANLSDEGADWCARLERSAQRSCKLVDDVAAWIGLGRRRLERARVDVGDLVDDLFDRIRFRGDAAPPSLTFEPPTRAVSGDARALQLALSHLLENAERFGGSPAQIRVRALAGDTRDGAGTGVTIQVSDAGPGLPPEAASRVFGLFERHLHADDEDGSGGVGLAIVRRVAERHGGAAWLDAPPGGGLTVSLYLPEPASL